mmetsp:Transcript_1383/g.5595  ORF Transcript_1383/g.5595 Transcript_1383/m.5595 type:complete len:302 (-) Transcript_1383:679-1584(-)
MKAKAFCLLTTPQKSVKMWLPGGSTRETSKGEVNIYKSERGAHCGTRPTRNGHVVVPEDGCRGNRLGLTQLSTKLNVFSHHSHTGAVGDAGGPQPWLGPASTTPPCPTLKVSNTLLHSASPRRWASSNAVRPEEFRLDVSARASNSRATIFASPNSTATWRGKMLRIRLRRLPLTSRKPCCAKKAFTASALVTEGSDLPLLADCSLPTGDLFSLSVSSSEAFADSNPPAAPSSFSSFSASSDGGALGVCSKSTSVLVSSWQGSNFEASCKVFQWASNSSATLSSMLVSPSWSAATPSSNCC